MAKSVFTCLLVFLLVVTLCHAHKGKHNKRDKVDKENYKMKLDFKDKQLNELSPEKTLEDIKKYDVTAHSKYYRPNVGDDGKHVILREKLEKGEKRRRLKLKKKQRKNKLGWIKLKKEEECEPECERGEYCIIGPLDPRPFCVRKRSLKKSIKLFHRYQKKEKKQWRKFKKEHYNNYDDDKKGKHGKDKHLNMHKYGHLLKKKGRKHLAKPLVPPYMEEFDDECSAADFNQMRTRLMGWFHVLHGQDHLLKKEKGSLKHFHKHVSVKKELREHDGNTCQCYKSAMWQFREMDKDQDDHLSQRELSMIEENSMEPCVRPFMDSCDKDANDELSADEWCCCFSSVVAPCLKKFNEMRLTGGKLSYLPRCDREGYFMREQCQGNVEMGDRKAGCWCVDYNGNEYKGTFTEGRAHCSKIAMRGLGDVPMM